MDPELVVAPCMGAWIETLVKTGNNSPTLVAPCMGAWIETDLGNYADTY